MNATFAFACNVPVDDKSHLRLRFDVREYEPTHGVWLIAAECQRWRGKYVAEGLYERTLELGEPFVLVERAASVEATLRALCDAAVQRAVGGGE